MPKSCSADKKSQSVKSPKRSLVKKAAANSAEKRVAGRRSADRSSASSRKSVRAYWD